MAAETWLNQLQESGYRLTGARRAVIDVIQKSRQALTPVQVFDRARKKYRELGLVSVYRTLEKLEELGLVQRVHQPQGCQAFVTAGEGHQHLLLCQQCGTVTLFEGDDLEGLINSIARRTGYQIKDHWLQLFGLCENCK
jgi:Fur family transcriptional regulator, ferric uptake regulator